MPVREMTYRDSLNEALRREMRRDPTVFLMGENIGARGGSFKVTAGLLDEFGPRRVIDTPLAEAAFTGAGIGAAITGMRPVVEILFVDFTTLVMDQMVNQAAKRRFMTQGKGKVPLVLRTQGGSGTGLSAQHSQSLEAWFYHVPGLRLVMPSTAHDAGGLLTSAIRCDDPVVFIEHKLLYQTRSSVPDEDYCIALGKADVKREGGDVTLIAWSNMVHRCLAAAGRAAGEGIDVEVVDPRTLSPLDTETILESVRKTGRAVIAQEAVRRGGVASDIASIIQRETWRELKAPVAITAGKNTPVPFNATLEAVCVPNEDDIFRAVNETVHFS